MRGLLAAQRLQLTRIAPVLADAARSHIKENPLRAYGFALRHGMEHAARLAAHEFLAVEDTLMDSEELDSMSVRQYRQLVVYRQACAAALKIFTGSHGALRTVWLPDEMAGTACTWIQCPKCPRVHVRSVGRHVWLNESSQWFRDYYQRVGERIRARPVCPDALRDPELLTLAVEGAMKCPACIKVAYPRLLRYTELMIEEIERRIAEMPFEISFQ
ncbi:hypothetical protein C8T65DRAFT_666610 [Cerioporus squamosus]|nr:hypothetical protein C8T65DRAFT_666610 [Cerioporus squamosus]